MRALVTGGCGFVGRHLVHELLARGDVERIDVADPIVPLTGGLPPTDWPLWGDGVSGDPRLKIHLRDCRDFFTEVQASDFDVVFHLAAMVGGREMIENRPLAVAEDLEIDAAMFRWATVGPRMPHVVYFSSSAAYPISMQTHADAGALHEDDIDWTGSIGLPDLSYGWAKLTGEYLARLAREAHGLRATVYRPFSGYGPDQDLTYPFPSICKRAVESSDGEIDVWGPGVQQRDFIHIDDCVRIVLDTWEQADVLNLSTGVGTSFIDLASMALVAAHPDRDPIVNCNPAKPVGVFRRVGDTSKQRSLDAVPRFTLDEGVQVGIEFWRSRAVGA